MRKIKPILERFENKIFYSPDGCWYWTASIRNGYGQFNMGEKIEVASRASWILHKGEIHNKLFVCHHCDNKLCVNPNHLFLGTQQDNVSDMDAKGRRVIAPSYGENHGCSKLTNRQVKYIRRMRKKGHSHKAIANVFKVTRPTISYILNGKTWTTV